MPNLNRMSDVTYVDGMRLRRKRKGTSTICNKCGVNPRRNLLRSECKECWNEYQLLYYKTVQGPNRTWVKYHLKKEYGITEEDVEKLLLAQQHQCAICETNISTEKFSVDHDHNTGTIRGLLCTPCNVGLGHFSDNISKLRKAINYLEQIK